MANSNILGKYSPYNTIIHRLDSRFKLFSLILLMVVTFLPYGNYTNRFIVLGFLTIIISLIMIIGKVSFKSFFKSLSSMWVMFIFLLIFMFFLPNEGKYLIYQFENGYALYYDGLLNVGHVILRLLLMVALTIILTSTTLPMDITYALEWYLTPLRIVKFPTQIVSLTISLALRFIPTLLNESNRIMNAQKSRGVDYTRGFLMSKIRSITTLIIPLLVSCFSRSDELAIAMEARGYDPYKKRSHYKTLHFTYRDLLAIFFILLVAGIMITASCFASYVPGFDDFLNSIFNIPTW